jgi:hypothetical protein
MDPNSPSTQDDKGVKTFSGDTWDHLWNLLPPIQDGGDRRLGSKGVKPKFPEKLVPKDSREGASHRKMIVMVGRTYVRRRRARDVRRALEQAAAMQNN